MCTRIVLFCLHGSSRSTPRGCQALDSSTPDAAPATERRSDELHPSRPHQPARVPTAERSAATMLCILLLLPSWTPSMSAATASSRALYMSANQDLHHGLSLREAAALKSAAVRIDAETIEAVKAAASAEVVPVDDLAPRVPGADTAIVQCVRLPEARTTPCIHRAHTQGSRCLMLDLQVR